MHFNISLGVGVMLWFNFIWRLSFDGKFYDNIFKKSNLSLFVICYGFMKFGRSINLSLIDGLISSSHENYQINIVNTSSIVASTWGGARDDGVFSYYKWYIYLRSSTPRINFELIGL